MNNVCAAGWPWYAKQRPAFSSRAMSNEGFFSKVSEAVLHSEVDGVISYAGYVDAQSTASSHPGGKGGEGGFTSA